MKLNELRSSDDLEKYVEEVNNIDDLQERVKEFNDKDLIINQFTVESVENKDKEDDTFESKDEKLEIAKKQLEKYTKEYENANTNLLGQFEEIDQVKYELKVLVDEAQSRVNELEQSVEESNKINESIVSNYEVSQIDFFVQVKDKFQYELDLKLAKLDVKLEKHETFGEFLEEFENLQNEIKDIRRVLAACTEGIANIEKARKQLDKIDEKTDTVKEVEEVEKTEKTEKIIDIFSKESIIKEPEIIEEEKQLVIYTEVGYEQINIFEKYVLKKEAYKKENKLDEEDLTIIDKILLFLPSRKNKELTEELITEGVINVNHVLDEFYMDEIESN